MARIPEHEVEHLKREIGRASSGGVGIELTRHGPGLIGKCPRLVVQQDGQAFGIEGVGQT